MFGRFFSILEKLERTLGDRRHRQSVRRGSLLVWVCILGITGLRDFAVAEQHLDSLSVFAAENPATYRAAIVMEPRTGTILFEKDARVSLPPASMVKMMTTIVVLEQVREGTVSLEDEVVTSRWAAGMGGSQVYLREGEIFTVREMLKAVMVHSANDAATALAEFVAGSTEAFVDLMNDKARQLGLRETQYNSPHGLPAGPGQDDDLTSARDLALVGQELLKFPTAMEWAAISRAPFRDGKFILTNPNRLLKSFRGADGIKTGYHSKAGHCVTATAKRGDLRLIAVVMGEKDRKKCFLNVSRLLSRGFAQYRMVKPVERGAPLKEEAIVEGGVTRSVQLIAGDEILAVIRKTDIPNVHTMINMPDHIAAPVRAGQRVGEVVVTVDGHTLGRSPALAVNGVEQSSVWERWWPF